MRTKRLQRFGLRLSQLERLGLERLAEHEGLSEAATLRRLLRNALAEYAKHDNSEVEQLKAVSCGPSKDTAQGAL